MRGLLRRAAEVLDEGPLHTLEVARRVLRLSGDEGAASAAVFALLADDGRFRVDERGVWSLEPDGSAPLPGSPDRRAGGPAGGEANPAEATSEKAAADGPPGAATPLEEVPFAVVDIETTGGSHARGHRITEVAVVEVHGGIVGETWDTLVNPGRRIPSRIARLTGITDRMVAGAPYFDHVADELLERLRGRVFVAHNVRFDWGFVRRQLAEAVGEVPQGPRLCTLRMARRFVPELERRNLDALARHFRLRIADRHRARGDAVATARILVRLLDEASARGPGDLGSLAEVC